MKKKNKYDDIMDIKIDHEITEKEIESDPDKARDTFLMNITENEDLRKKMWEKLFWDRKAKKEYRNNKNAMIQAAEDEWSGFDEPEKINWYNYVTNDGKALGTVGEINMIMQLVKVHKGNMKKVWQDLKAYGKSKKETKDEDE